MPGPKNHADIIAAWDGRLAAMEVKGKTGSAARQNAQQCITWASELTSAQLSDADQREKDTVVRAYLQCIEQLGLPHEMTAPDEEPIPVKGILAVNPYRDLPLDQRTEPAFPHPMLRTVNEGRLCALTTLQLLGMVLHARKNPNDAERLARLLFDSVGVISEFGDWRTFLSHRPDGLPGTS